MASLPTEILEAGYALFDLAKSRDIASRNYDSEKNKFSDLYLAINDEDGLRVMYDAFVKRNDLIKRVLEESIKFFEMLSEPLQYGLKELGKPLVLPKPGPFNSTAARCLVVALKPLESKNVTLEASVNPEYSYDVQVIDLTKDRS